MSIPERIPPDIDLTVDPAIIEKARLLLGTKPDINQSSKWIHSPEKLKRERSLALFFLTCVSPALAVSALGVLIATGRPIIHQETVAFLGVNDNLVGLTEMLKVRSLKNDVSSQEVDPLSTSAFQGGRKKSQPSIDPRVHSLWGALLRKTGMDEIPQLFNVIAGQFALIGPRGYTLREIAGLKILLKQLGENADLKDYPKIMSEVCPRPSIAGLYSLLRKDLTVMERLILDQLSCTCATPKGDIRIFLASLNSVIKMAGAR